MKTFKQFLNEASYSSDMNYRNEALKVYNELTKYIQNNKNQIEKNKLSSYKGFKVDMSFVNSKYDDLIVYLIPKKNKSIRGDAATGKTKSGKWVLILKVLIEDYSLDFILLGDEFDRKDFIHEFIHYLDTKRKSNDDDSVSYIDNNDYSSYFNNPAEFNAYFLEVFDKVIEYYDEGKIPNKYLYSFDSFKKFFKLFTNQDFYKHLKGKWKRKFDKRLYQLYSNLKEL